MKKYIAIALVLVLCLSLTACGASVDGYYETLDGEGGIKFSKDFLSNEGSFVLYEDGEPREQDRYTRNTNTWELDGDLLILLFEGYDAGFCRVYGACLVFVEDEEELPEYWRYIAPEGLTFDYEIDNYVFYADGTYKYDGWYYSDWGNYYRVNNTIYMKDEYDDEYEAAFYIYDGDHIIDADYVLVKDSLLRQIEKWFVSFASDLF